MKAHSGYLLEVLRSGGDFTLYRARRPGERSVLALVVTGQQPSPQSDERLAHEYGLAAELDPTWAALPLALTRLEGQPMLLLEDSGGEPLDRIIAQAQGQPMEMEVVLQFASDLAAALSFSVPRAFAKVLPATTPGAVERPASMLQWGSERRT